MTPSSLLSLTVRWRQHLKSHFPRRGAAPQITSKRVDATKGEQGESRKVTESRISCLFFELTLHGATVHMLSVWKSRGSFSSLRADSTGFQAPPPFRRPRDKRRGALKRTAHLSQSGRLFSYGLISWLAFTVVEGKCVVIATWDLKPS